MESINEIIGLAIGDSLGVPAEFKSREELKKYDYIIELCDKFDKYTICDQQD